jgi:ribosomal protein S11
MLENTSFFVKANFDSMRIVVKGSTLKRSLGIFKHLRYKPTPIMGFKICVPVLHNGCRPPKKRRI